MNRALLQSAVEGVVSARGYTFLIESPEQRSYHLTAYPALVMAQPKFNKQEGRRFGKITYDISLTMLCQGAKLSPAERSELYDDMEFELVDICVELSCHEKVASICNLSISPTSSPVDNHGAIAMVATAQVTTFFNDAV